MSEWITERLPTADDANKQGYVLVCSLGDMVSAWHWRDVLNRPWMPLPKPHVPPPTREELVQDLIDAIDTIHVKPRSSWTADVLEAREKLK